MSFFCILTLLVGAMPYEEKFDKLTREEKDLASSSLVSIKEVVPDIVVDLKYATANNFVGEVIYDSNDCFVCGAVALKLQSVQQELKSLGLGLKIWDGFRPMSAQKRFWELVPDERYVSDPAKGGRHTRGTAVDVTLVTSEGLELEMPTDFDEFSEKAHRGYQDTSKEAIANALLLEKVMEKHGFVGLPSEWWHFDLVGWESFSPIQ